MKNFIKILLTSFITIFLIIGYSNISFATDHTAERQVIKELKKEIYDLGSYPVKKKSIFQRDQKWIVDLKKQLEELKKEKAEEEAKLKALEKVLGQKISSEEIESCSWIIEG